jgi:hypothetical protein
MEYETPQVVQLPDAVTSISANPLLKQVNVPDGPHSTIATAPAYSSDE